MYGYFGSAYDLGSSYDLASAYDLGDADYDGVIMDTLNKKVVGVPVWGLLLAGAALMYTKPGKRLLGGLGLGAAKKNPSRRRRKNRRKSRRSRR
jgi:hypothetical protein